MLNIGIIGFGEIGKGLFEVYKQNNIIAKIFDPYLNLEDDLNGIEILNICIPYSKNFVSIVQNYIDTIKPRYTVIHSTVSPGTTKQINGKVCHSPVRGLHPNLDMGIKTFLKFIGSEDSSVALEYQNHLDSFGIKSHICKNSLTSEYSKILDTTYYGLCISFHNEVNQICNDLDIPFDEVMSMYNETYNDGYSKLGKMNVIRPVLNPGDKIGGHCVIPNLKLLVEHYNSPLFDGILKFE